MGEKTSSSSSGIGFVGLLTIVFITLKLLGKIDWSWWWVLSPMWISALLIVGFIALVLGGAGIVWLLDAADERHTLNRSRERLRFGARRTTARVIDVERKKDDTFVN